MFWVLSGLLAARTSRQSGAGWAAGAFAALATILTFIVVAQPEESRWEAIVSAIQLAAVAVVPYLLYRFTSTLAATSKRWHVPALVATLVMCAAALALAFAGFEDGMDGALRVYLFALLGQWTWLSALSLRALWRMSKAVPSVARMRLRLIAGAMGLLNIALAFVVAVESTELSTAALTLAAASAIAFFLAFSPPPWLRAVWRRPERQRLDTAVQELITAVDESEIAERLLPHIIELVGAERAALVGRDGNIIATLGSGASSLGAEAPELPVAPIDISSSLRVWVPAVMPLFGRDEITMLGALGAMADLGVERAQLLREERDKSAVLERLADKLKETNAALEAEVLERHEAEMDAISSREEAERANEAKSEFLSRMSHELRTPLNSILGFAQLLELDDLSDDQGDSVDHILKGGHHLLGLINEVLDISRIESGNMTISPEPVDICELIEEVGDMMRPVAADRRIDVSFELDGARSVHVLADRQRLKQVLINLLSNAIKYNRESGRVRMTAQTLPERVAVSVSDTGAGIPQSQLDRLFIPFDRLDVASSTVEGTGLGLALSKGLAELMGGSLQASSIPGEGSTFVVTLHLAETPSDQVASRGFGPEGGMAAHITVLYIEDNLNNVKLVEKILGAYPELKLLTAMQGRTGLELARHHSPDLVLLDLHLPDASGDELLRQLRAEPATRAAKIVILSADATAGRVARLKEAGADDYLTKPLDVARFRDVVENTIKAMA